MKRKFHFTEDGIIENYPYSGNINKGDFVLFQRQHDDKTKKFKYIVTSVEHEIYTDETHIYVVRVN